MITKTPAAFQARIKICVQYKLEGLWYVNAHGPGIPMLRFSEAKVLLSPRMGDAEQGGRA
jgi:hypothetical protein